MSTKVARTIAWSLREARPYASLLVTVVTYLSLKAVLFLLTSDVELIAPSGSPNLGVAALAVIVLGLRIWVLFAVPTIFVYRVARRVHERLKKHYLLSQVT